jgi:hypothetical protein
MDLELWQQMLAGVGGASVYLLVKYVYQRIRGANHYQLKCKYPNCKFKIAVSDPRYAYICDDLMADHQNRKHPLEEIK